MECKILFNVEGSRTVNTLVWFVFLMMFCVSQKLVPFGEFFFTDITFEWTLKIICFSLNICILMDSSFWFDTVNMEWSIVNF